VRKFLYAIDKNGNVLQVLMANSFYQFRYAMRGNKMITLLKWFYLALAILFFLIAVIIGIIR
jgi:hypothetical protein